MLHTISNFTFQENTLEVLLLPFKNKNKNTSGWRWWVRYMPLAMLFTALLVRRQKEVFKRTQAHKAKENMAGNKHSTVWKLEPGW